MNSNILFTYVKFEYSLELLPYRNYKLMFMWLLILYVTLNNVRCLLKYITTLYQIQIFSHCLFFFHLVFNIQIFFWTKFIMLNNLMKHFLGYKNFCVWNLMHLTDKYSQHNSIIWLVWLNGWVFLFKLSGCGFESHCSESAGLYLKSKQLSPIKNLFV